NAGKYRQSSLRSGHIYQLYAYLRSQERDCDPPSLNARGMLLYPAVDGDVDEEATIQGHRIRFATVDLAGDSPSIRNRLLALASMDQSVNCKC
ncbi:MAG: 5-methylcytosine-specific restriction endonuclease system specificity protein McrC, partial [Chloroflexi bacterium]|nr:5-methylcytosine-specific restriction endonuclease system specificity protein McrC [Chloroflexota bacterium]